MKSTQPTNPSFIRIIVRAFVVGLVYALASALIALLLGPLSRLQPTPDTFLLWVISGTLLCLALTPFILHSKWSKWNTILATWAVSVFIRAFGLGIEGSLFTPTRGNLAIIGAGVGVVVGLLFAWLAVTLLSVGTSEPAGEPSVGRNWWGWTWRILLVGLAYFVFYFGFGSANALLYTRSFYENNPQYGLSLPPVGVLFLAQLLRAPLFGLGAFFIARSTNLPSKWRGLWLGLLLYVVGGLGPYLEVTFRTMPLGFNLATLLELFLQNFLAGLVAARLYK